RSDRSRERATTRQRFGTCSGDVRSENRGRFISSHAEVAREKLHRDSECEIRGQESRDTLDVRNRRYRRRNIDISNCNAEEITAPFTRVVGSECFRNWATNCRRSLRTSAVTEKSARRILMPRCAKFASRCSQLMSIFKSPKNSSRESKKK